MIRPHRRGSAYRQYGLSCLSFLFLSVGAYASVQHASPVDPSRLVSPTMTSQKDIDLPSSLISFLSEPQLKPEPSNFDGFMVDEHGSSSSVVQAMHEQIQFAKKIASIAKYKKHPRFLSELQSQIRENELALEASVVDGELPNSAMKKMEALRQLLWRATNWQDRCGEMVKRLRSSVIVIEDKVSALKEGNKDLGRLAARTVPKGFHCLALQLTIQYYSDLGGPIIQNFSKIGNGLLHYVIYTENILAATVIINSTVYSAKEPHQHVFHVLTDGLNHAAFQTWFQKNTPDKAFVEIKNLETFHALRPPFSFHDKSRKYTKLPRLRAHFRQEENLLMQKRIYLHFILSEVFPNLEKVLVVDDDVVVQKDLSHLWEQDLNKKVIGAVGSCETSSDLGGMLSWACMNMVDLAEWRRQGLKEKLEPDLDMWHALTLIRESRTHVIDETVCHVIDLGDTPSEWVNSTLNADVVHYRGYAKPWLGVGMNSQYRDLWTRFVSYENPLLRACNIHK